MKVDIQRGARIRKLREEVLGFDSQDEFARFLSKGRTEAISRGAVGNWELGKGIKQENLSLVSAKTGVSVDWIANGIGPDPLPRGHRDSPEAAREAENRHLVFQAKHHEQGLSTPNQVRGARLRYLRQRVLGFQNTQDFAAFISEKLTGDDVAHWEDGDSFSQHALSWIVKATGAPVDWLVFGRGPPPEPDPMAQRIALTMPQLPDREAMPLDVPVRGMALGSDGGDFTFTGHDTAYVRRPPGLATDRTVYALYVQNDSMAPKFEQGDLVYLSGTRPPKPGEYVLIELHPETEGTASGFIKRFKKRKDGRYVLEQFNPAKDIEIDERQVKLIHRVIPTSEMLGA
jgi:phage repressor protein C with HTH and peptisase S24 domain